MEQGKSIFKIYVILFLIGWSSVGYSQEMNIVKYQDNTIPYIETNPSKYNFIYPVCTDILDSANYYPNSTDLYYIKATYGTRYLSSTATKNDNHGGIDFWHTVKCDGITHDNSNLYPILSMCDGTISEVLHGTDAAMEATSTGRSVQVTCDSVYQSGLGDIIINYRHLDSIWTKPWTAWNTSSITERISKGDTIGIVGASGYTSAVHLHLSAEGNHPVYGTTNINTNRLFDPNLSSGVLRELKDAKIELLQDWADSALFRITCPFNQPVNRYEFTNNAFSAVFDHENAYSQGASTRDDHDVLSGFDMYVYQFNGKQTAKSRYDNEKSDMPANYPASPQRDTNLAFWGYSHIPITYDTIAYIYDIMVKDLPVDHDKNDFVVKVSDVWGNTVEGNFTVLSVELTRFDANLLEDKTVAISWNTVSEDSHDYFVVERSSDGVHWEEVQKIEGRGNVFVGAIYHIIDTSPYQGVSYYRLVSTDLNGDHEYSIIKKISLNERTSSIQIYPNPARNSMTIEGLPNDFTELKIYNVLGVEVTDLITISEYNEAKRDLNVSKLVRGFYLIKMGTNVYKIYKQ